MQQLLIELHCHTQLLGWQPFSRRRLRQFLEHGRRAGLDFLAITEHADVRSFWSIYKALDELDWQWQGVCLLAGAEVTVREQADILVIGAPSALPELKKRLGKWPVGRKRPGLADLLAAAEDLEMIRIGAHPLRPGRDVRHIPAELLRRLDALEINARDLHRSAGVTDLAVGLGLPLVGGSDAHRSREVGRVVNQVPTWVRGVDDLRAAIGRRQTAIVYK